MGEARLQRQDPAVLAHADLHVVDLLALVGGADEVLAPVLGPLDRHPEVAGGERDEDLLGIELDDLDAEAAADVGGDDVDLLDVHVEQAAQPAADAGRGLRGVVHQQRALLVEPRHDGAALERRRGAALDLEAPLEDVRRLRHGGVDIAVLLGDAGDHVVGAVEVHERRVEVEIGGDRQRLVGDPDRAGRVLGDVAVAGDDHDDRLADVADLVLGKRVLRAPVQDRLVRDDQRQRLGERPLEVVVRVDGVDALDVERAGDVDVGDARVRVVGADERRVRRVRLEVVRVAPLAAKQPVVLPPLHALAEHSGRQGWDDIRHHLRAAEIPRRRR